MAQLATGKVTIRPESNAISKYPQKLGDKDKQLIEAVVYRDFIDDDFKQALVMSNTTQAGAAYTGATGEVIGFHSREAAYELSQLAVASAAIVTPYQSTGGLYLKPVAAADALEVTNGITSLSRMARTVGSMPAPGCFFECKIYIDDISDVTEMVMGWRKAEAYRADYNDYDEMAAWDIGTGADGRFNMSTILNGGATSTTNSAATAWADAGTHTLRVEVRNSGVVKFLLNGTQYHKGFTFDSGEVIVPFLALDTETGDPDVRVAWWRCGYMD